MKRLKYMVWVKGMGAKLFYWKGGETTKDTMLPNMDITQKKLLIEHVQSFYYKKKHQGSFWLLHRLSMAIYC